MRQQKEIGVDKVATYIRWSTEDQADGTTLEVQREACQAYMVSQGWGINPDLVFIDDGISGGTLDRPALNRLRAQVKAGLVDCVVVYKLDRLSRSVVDMVKLVLDEWEGLCYVKSARDPIDTITQTGKMFFYQLMSFAEWERSVIKERTFSGKLRRAHEGKNPGVTAAYGFRLGPEGQLVVEPGEAAVVQFIFRLYLSGLGCRQIARRLGGEGYVSATGQHFSEGQLARMLSNPIYKGTLVYGQRITTAKGRRVKSDRPHVIKEGWAPALIDAATFDAVQALKAARPGIGRRQGTGRSLSSLSLLSGLLRCRCGHSYCGNGGTGARSRYRYYYCGGAQAKGHDFCHGGRIRQDLLDHLVVQALLEQYMGQGAREALESRVTAGLEAQLREARAVHDALSQQTGKLGEKESRLKMLFLDARVTVEEFRELKTDLNKQMADLKAKLAAAQSQVRDATQALRHRHELTEHLSRINCWDVLELTERKQLLRQFVTQILAYRDKQTGNIQCTISWRWGSETAPAPSVHEVVQSRFTQASVEAFKRRQRDGRGRLRPDTVAAVTANRPI